MNDDLKLYYDYTISPLGKLFYKTLWEQLEEIRNKQILDFGSGFAFTANFLADSNEVTALEIDDTVIKYAEKNSNFTQLHGDVASLQEFEDETFDVVVCHLVLEFVDNPKEILEELHRVLKKDGLLSIVKHNRNGRIIQAIAQNYNLDEANKLLEGGFSFSSAFGDIKYYENDDLIHLTENKYRINEVYGIRVLASLHGKEITESENWVARMFEIEKKLCKIPDYIKISFFNHLIMQKIK